MLLDLKLPKVDGLEVLRRIKGDAGPGRIPVVVLTLAGRRPDLARSYELGVNSYLVKPVEFAAFGESVSRLGLYWLVVNQFPQESGR